MIDHDDVLARWARGEDTFMIAMAVGAETANTINGIVARARMEGDPRAKRRRGLFMQGRPSDALRMKLGAAVRLHHRRMRGRRKPATDADLARAIEAYAGPVTQCPPGAHAGWRPAWMRNA